MSTRSAHLLDSSAKLETIRKLIARIDIREDKMTIALQNGATIVADLVGQIRKTKARSAVAHPEELLA